MSGLVGDVTPVIHQSKTMDLDAVQQLGCTTLHQDPLHTAHYTAHCEDQPGKIFN